MSRIMHKGTKKKWQIPLPLLMLLIVFLAIILSIFLTTMGIGIMMRLGIMPMERFFPMPLVMMAIVSMVVTTAITIFISKRYYGPVQELMSAVDKVAGGDYTVRVPEENAPDNVRELCEKFNHMVKELGSVEMLRSSFISSFSHEFKTPIVSIRGFAKALKWEELPDKEREEYLDIIISESDRLADLSGKILMLSRIEHQAILTDVEAFDLTEQLRQVVVLLAGKWEAKHLDIRFEADEVTIQGNAELLNQVWINLLDNAIKFSPERGAITMDLKRANGKVAVTVSDEGPGIPADVKTHVFERFYQGDSSHATKGNGLGLAIAKRIVLLHGGDIRCEDAKGGGTAFVVELPASLSV